MRCFVYILSALLLPINLALAYRLFHGEGDWHQYQSLRLDLQQEHRVQGSLLEENQRLSAEVADLKDGQEVMAEIARYDLGLVREGEFFIFLVDDQDDSPANKDSSSPLLQRPYHKR